MKNRRALRTAAALIAVTAMAVASAGITGCSGKKSGDDQASTETEQSSPEVTSSGSGEETPEGAPFEAFTYDELLAACTDAGVSEESMAEMERNGIQGMISGSITDYCIVWRDNTPQEMIDKYYDKYVEIQESEYFRGICRHDKGENWGYVAFDGGVYDESGITYGCFYGGLYYFYDKIVLIVDIDDVEKNHQMIDDIIKTLGLPMPVVIKVG